jgi:hypothetical protein
VDNNNNDLKSIIALKINTDLNLIMSNDYFNILGINDINFLIYQEMILNKTILSSNNNNNDKNLLEQILSYVMKNFSLFQLNIIPMKINLDILHRGELILG